MVSRPVVSLLLFLVSGWVGAEVEFSTAERNLIALHGPWPPVSVNDSSNRVSANSDAIRLGERLFFDHKLGGDSAFSCASCHDPGLFFTDGKTTGSGRTPLTRNTPTVMNLPGQRWFGWGGEADSLWAQSIRPIVAADEMAATPESVKSVIASNGQYSDLYLKSFGLRVSESNDDEVLVNVAKALAAYQETLISLRTPFDDFRDALLRDDIEKMKRYPASAQRGLKLFVGEGSCNLCHFGPAFTNGEFGDIGIEFFIEGGVDPGRYRGIQTVKASPFNRMGNFNDGDAKQNAISTRQVRLLHRNWGEFKIPGLRGVAMTAPYMHNGSVETLEAVVRHYSELDESRLHRDGEKILKPLNLDQRQIDDLVSFLESLGFE